MHKFKMNAPLRIQNSLSGNTNVLMGTGYYKLLKRVTKGDTVIDKHGNPTKVKDVIYKGRQKVIKLYHEAWHATTSLTKDQEFVQALPDTLLMPSIVHYESLHNAVYHSYSTGFATTLLLYSSCVSGENIVIFARKCEMTSIKRINHCLATVFGIHNVEIHDGSYLTRYVIPAVCLPSNLLESIKHTNIASSNILGTDQNYILGMAHGIQISHKACEVFDNDRPKIHLKILCDWINISLHSEHPKQSKLFIEDDHTQEDVWDLILNDSDTYIANNICVCTP